jgi:flagellar assembly factor FliW
MTATQSRPSAAAADVDPVDSYIVFPEGLVGCGSWKRFVLMSDDSGDLPVAVLSCVDEPGVALMVTDPAFVLPGYVAPLTTEVRTALGLVSEMSPTVYCTLTIAADGAISANLLGPLVINAERRQGLQLVLTDSPYSARHPVGSIEADSCSS